jgi:hypothetical protein
VLKEGHQRATAHADTKSQAVSRAREMVRREGGGEILIVNHMGKIADARTVAERNPKSADR